MMKRGSEIQFNSKNPETFAPGTEEAAMFRTCDLLWQSKFKKCDLLSDGSNYVFLAALVKDGMEFKAIYKPRKGETPLWDFPDGTLYKREYAAFIMSQAIEWRLIPPTIIRNGPYGVGSVQWFVESKNGNGYYSGIKDTSLLKKVALFDYLVNNADRKASHFLEGKGGRLWLVDHGLTFNSVSKLRTILWDFSGKPIPDGLLADVSALQDKLKPDKHLRQALGHLLDVAEVKALESRINTILEKPTFVYPGPYRSVPWPWY
jgi:hypothetical protein